MKSSDELEREGDATRASINETLDELRARITPGQVLDQLVEYGRSTNGGMLVRNLRQQVVDNPLPLVLVGVGVAWLMVAEGRSRRVATETRQGVGEAAEAARSAAERAAGGISSAADTVRTAASRSAEAVGTAADNVRSAASHSAEAASSLIDSVRARAGSTYDRASRATRRAAATIGDSAATVQGRGRDFLELLQDQPLALAGLGVTVGAVLGAALPATEMENRLVGEASDDLKERMQRIARKTKETASSVYEQSTEAMRSTSDGRPASATANEQSASTANSAATEHGVSPPADEASR